MRDYLEARARRLPYERTEVLWEALRGDQRTRDLEGIAGDDALIVLANRYRGVLGGFQFGSAAERLFVVTAIAVSLPLSMCGLAEVTLSNM